MSLSPEPETFEIIDVSYPIAHDEGAATKDLVYLNANGMRCCDSKALEDHQRTMKLSPFVVPKTTPAALREVVTWCNECSDESSPSFNFSYPKEDWTGAHLDAALRAAHFLGVKRLFRMLCYEWGRRVRHVRLLAKPPKELAAIFEERIGLRDKFPETDPTYVELIKLLEAQRKEAAQKQDIPISCREGYKPIGRQEPIQDSPIQHIIHDYVMRNRTWEADGPACSVCKKEFLKASSFSSLPSLISGSLSGSGAFIRHHCRACGRNICSSCTLTLDPGTFTPVQQPAHSVSLKDSVSCVTTRVGLTSNDQYVCRPCHTELSTLNKTEKEFCKSVIKECTNIDVKDVTSLLAASPVWLHVAGWYLERMRALAVTGYHTYSPEHQWIVKANMKLFSGHRNWVMLAVLATDWDDVKSRESAAKLFGCESCMQRLCIPKETMCIELCCPRDCCEGNPQGLPFGQSQILRMLTHLANFRSEWVETKMRRPLIHGLSGALSDESLFLMLFPLLLDILAKYPSESIINMLLARACETPLTVWNFLLDVERRATRCVTCQSLARMLYYKLGQDSAKTQSVISMEDVSNFTLLVDCMRLATAGLRSQQADTDKDVDRKMASALLRHNLVTETEKGHTYVFRQPVWFPFPPNTDRTSRDRIEKFELGNVRIMTSKTKPVKFSFYMQSGQKRSMLWKNESVLKDSIMCNVMNLVNETLKSLEYLPIKCYGVLQTSDVDGIVEWMDRTQSIQDALSKRPTEEPNKLYQTLREMEGKHKGSIINYLNSSAVYVSVTYLFGVSDRHLDNLMISLDDGNVVHIDYGFIFSRAITEGYVRHDNHLQEVLDCVTDMEISSMYDRVRRNSYDMLRRFHPIIHLLMQHVALHERTANTDPLWTEQQMYEWIIDRCWPGRSDEFALQEFDKRVQASKSQFVVKDAMHGTYRWYADSPLGLLFGLRRSV